MDDGKDTRTEAGATADSRNVTGAEGSTPVTGGDLHEDTRTEAGATGIPLTPQVALDKAIGHLDTAKGYFADIAGTWKTVDGREITKARRAIIGFAAQHNLSDQVAGLVAEQAAEDKQRAEKETGGEG